jgi:uncharacterized protein
LKKSLLDVNCLIALFDFPHASHAIVRDWFLGSAHRGWLTCPLTENGCVRIMSSKGYARQKPAIAVVENLREAFNDPSHDFIADDFSITSGGWSEPSLLTSAQITDLYLLKLAINNNARLITLDKRIQYSVVEGAKPDDLVILTDPNSVNQSRRADLLALPGKIKVDPVRRG